MASSSARGQVAGQRATRPAQILNAFETAELETDPAQRASWLTFVVVGGGSTGVEMAGQIAELARDTLPGDFNSVDPRTGAVLLLEAADRVLPSFPPSLSARAARSLEELGVSVLTGHKVVDVQPDSVHVQTPGGAAARMPTRTIIWAAGVTASPLAHGSGGAQDRAGRVIVEADLTLPGHPEVIALGDMVRVRDPATGTARELPGLAPVAMQQGRYAGRLIRARLAGGALPPFHYRDKACSPRSAAAGRSPICPACT